MLHFTPRICRKRIIPLLLWIHCILPKAHSFTPHFHWQRLVEFRAFAENAKFDSAFSTKMFQTIHKRTFTKTALNLTPHFRQQRSAMLRAFSRNGEWSKTSNIWAKLKNFRKCWLYCVLYLLVTERCKKTFKNRLWKSRACVPLRCEIPYSIPSACRSIGSGWPRRRAGQSGGRGRPAPPRYHHHRRLHHVPCRRRHLILLLLLLLS